MNENKQENKQGSIEKILKTYSIVSGQGGKMLAKAVFKVTPEETLSDPGKVDWFLKRFSVQKPFRDLIIDALSTEHINLDNLSEDIPISKNILGKVISQSALPNIIPIKKMKALLNVLHIPISRAAESIKVSMTRFNVESSFVGISRVAMSRSKKMPFNIAKSNNSRESLKRGLDAYINRLLEEGE